jgi:hypothetical protein
MACPPPGASSILSDDAGVTFCLAMLTGNGFVSQCAFGPSA